MTPSRRPSARSTLPTWSACLTHWRTRAIAHTLRRLSSGSARFAAELSYLRRHGDEPVLDLTRRVIATMDLDVELMATRQYVAESRRDQLGTFMDAVAGYADIDGDASLAGLLAYFQAEIDQGAGLEQAVPSDREAVKLLTVHKAKGLEWNVVFLPALMKGIFPSDRVTDNWVTSAAALPADLRGDAAAVPQLAEVTNSAMTAYRERLAEQQLLAEDRLAYVGVTRAKRVLVGSGHLWRPDAIKPRSASSYLQAIITEARRQGRARSRSRSTSRAQSTGCRGRAAAVACASGSRRFEPANGSCAVGDRGP